MYLLYVAVFYLLLCPQLTTQETFPSQITLDPLLEGAHHLSDFANAYLEHNRVFGGAAHQDTIDYLYRELTETGYYDVTKQPQVHLWGKIEQNLTVNDGYTIGASAMTYTPSVNVTAGVVHVLNGGCETGDYSNNVAGKIALLQRGECSFGEKSVYAAAAQAAGVVVYNDVAGFLVGGTLGSPESELGPYAPIVGISLAAGEGLVEDIGNGEDLAVHLYINSHVENRTTYNVIAQTKVGDPDNVVSLGGHTDSVEAGPGINDDGSGIISNLVIAKALTGFSVKNAVRFFFWTAEEFGLLGSSYYVNSLDETELAKIKLYLNFDMIASPNYALMVYDGDGSSFNQSGPPGSGQLQHLFQDYFTSRNLSFVATQFDGRSDYAAFIDHGIPAGGLFTGAENLKKEAEADMFGGQAGLPYDAHYHKAGDTIDNLNHEAFLLNSQATAFAVATYANSLGTIPPRGTEQKIQPKPMRRNPAKHTHTDESGSACFHSQVWS